MPREFVTDNPGRIGLTPSERAEHYPGYGIQTNGEGKRYAGHLNLVYSEADLYEIRVVHVGAKSVPTYRWFRRQRPRIT